MAEQHHCIRCNVNVTGRPHAIACDDCGRWNHRKCGTGWHRRLNNRAGHPNLGLYKLVTLLKEESLTVDIQIRLVSDNLLSKLRRKKYKKVHGNLEDCWDKCEEDKLTTTALLRLHRARPFNNDDPHDRRRKAIETRDI